MSEPLLVTYKRRISELVRQCDDSDRELVAALARIDALTEALAGVVDLAEFWIGRGMEPDMSEERYRIWTALGYHSHKLRSAKALLEAEK